MRFHGLMLLRDEADILPQTLDHLLSWADGLYIFDLGSVDGTWDIVQDYARRDQRVIALDSRPLVFHDHLRAMIFDRARRNFSDGDWVARVDGDEFYHVAPPQFIAEHLTRYETALNLQWYYFRLTRQEAADYEDGTVDLDQDRRKPIEQRRRYYKVSEYPEPRLFRYRRRMQWPNDTNGPFNAGFTAKARIPIRHYPTATPGKCGCASACVQQ